MEEIPNTINHIPNGTPNKHKKQKTVQFVSTFLKLYENEEKERNMHHRPSSFK